MTAFAKKKPNFYSFYTANGLTIVKKLEEIQATNGVLPMNGAIEIYEKSFGQLPDNRLDNFNKAVGIDGYVNEPEGTLKCIAGEHLSNLMFDLSRRYSWQYQPLQTLSEQETMEKYGLNIFADEVLHDNINRVDWLEEKTITTSYTYSGYRYRNGNAFSATFGSLNVIKNTTNYFAHIDRGSLFITNKRMIFVGKEKRQNRTIRLDDILEFDIFRDGILLGKANGRKPLIHFAEFIQKTNEAPKYRDDLNRTVRILYRVISKTQFQTISNPKKSYTQQ